jgi:hypothetical protein
MGPFLVQFPVKGGCRGNDHWRADAYVDRIFRGEKPADLPVQAPTKYETVLNMKTAVPCRVLGEHYKSGDRNKIVLCDTTAELDMKPLIWTRGEPMPLDHLRERLKCPKCGSRNVSVWFEVPGLPHTRAAE